MQYSGKAENIYISLQQIGAYIQDNMYKILSESAEYCRIYDKNILVLSLSQFQLRFAYTMRMPGFTR